MIVHFTTIVAKCTILLLHLIYPYMTFERRVFSVIRKIHRGQTLTYAHVARWAGRPRAYRAVGNILNKNDDPRIPCHRVVRSDGKSGGYNRGAKEKIRRLKTEGIHPS